MKVHRLETEKHWQGKLFCVTHSTRPIEAHRHNPNFLSKRFGLTRLGAAPPFEQLTPASIQDHFPGGQITVWKFDDEDHRQPRLVAHIEPEYTPRHAIWHRGQLWVLGGEILAVYNTAMRRTAVVEDPWLAGGHTIAPDGAGRFWVSCSGSDSVLVVDERSLQVADALRVPESLYGHNYPLKRTDSVVDHFVPTDLQLTHINCAWPYKGGALISAFIPGAIGWFTPEGDYRELTRGFVGCHSARVSRSGTIYFCDSCFGAVVFLDEKHRIARRVSLESRFLQDAIELSGSTWAASCADRNSVVLFDECTGEELQVLDYSAFGRTVLFLSYGQ